MASVLDRKSIFVDLVLRFLNDFVSYVTAPWSYRSTICIYNIKNRILMSNTDNYMF